MVLPSVIFFDYIHDHRYQHSKVRWVLNQHQNDDHVAKQVENEQSLLPMEPIPTKINEVIQFVRIFLLNVADNWPMENEIEH